MLLWNRPPLVDMFILDVYCASTALRLSFTHVEHVWRVRVDVLMINENVSAALLRKGSLPLNNAVPLL